MTVATSPANVLVHAERTADPRVVRWVLRGHLAGPCIEPVRHTRDADDVPPFASRLLAVAPQVVAVTIHAEEHEDGDVLRVDVAATEPAAWTTLAGAVQAAVREAAALRWWPTGVESALVVLGRAGQRPVSLPSGPCRSCPHSSSSSSTCGRPPGRPPAST